MYRNVLAVAAAAAALSMTAAAGIIPGLPDCAQPCVTNTNYGGCNQVDVKCICSNMPLLANLACCVGNLCDASGQNAVITFADTLCKGYGVNDLPAAATCAPGAASTPLSGSAATQLSTSIVSFSAAQGATSSTSGAGSMTTASTAAAASNTGAAADHKPQGVGLAMGVLGLLAVL